MTTPAGAIEPAMIQAAIQDRRQLQSGASRTRTMLVLSLMGGIGLVLGLVFTFSNPNAAPTCDGQPMSTTGTCTVLSNRGDGGTFTYQQMKDRRNSSHRRWEIIGWSLAGLDVVLLVLAFQAFDPKKPWGTATSYMCPRCGRGNLREKTMSYRVTRGRTTYKYPGIVTLCAAGCDYAWFRWPQQQAVQGR